MLVAPLSDAILEDSWMDESDEEEGASAGGTGGTGGTGRAGNNKKGSKNKKSKNNSSNSNSNSSKGGKHVKKGKGKGNGNGYGKGGMKGVADLALELPPRIRMSVDVLAELLEGEIGEKSENEHLNLHQVGGERIYDVDANDDGGEAGDRGGINIGIGLQWSACLVCNQHPPVEYTRACLLAEEYVQRNPPDSYLNVLQCTGMAPNMAKNTHTLDLMQQQSRSSSNPSKNLNVNLNENENENERNVVPLHVPLQPCRLGYLHESHYLLFAALDR
tara:strand:+ start:93 stop:914 length:822 start_codon:yes stop_codon:yes gene_type:complete